MDGSRGRLSFPRFAFSCGVGVFTGCVLIGLFRVVTGAVGEHLRQWAAASVGFLVLGALAGYLLAVTRRALFAELVHRELVLALAGAVSLPLALTIGSTGEIGTGAGTVIFVLGAITGGTYIVRARTNPRRAQNSPFTRTTSRR